MLERGDVVVYKFHAASNPMDGMVAIVLGPHREADSVAIKLLEAGKINPWINGSPIWTKDPFFNVKNCKKIGHIDLPPAD